MADRKISDLTALTTPASGDFLPIVDISEAAAASKNKKITYSDFLNNIPTGTITSTMILDGTILNADINASAAIVDTKLATIATGGKVSNSATTATDANTASAIVARDASGNFSAGTITAALTGAASSNVLKAGDTMTGALGIIAGSAASPGLFFSGDTNSGLYSPGADQVAVSTGGTGRLFVDASGNIGINTTPSSLGTSVTTLEVKGGSTTRSGGLRVSSSDSSVKGAFYIYDGTGVLGTESATPLDLYTGNSPRLTITSAGNVGVGTSTPSKKLEIANGDIRLADGYTISWGDDTYRIFRNGSQLRFDTNGSQALAIDSSQRVGIGTAGPDANSQLHIVGSGYQPLYVNTTGAGGGGAAFFRSGTQALYAGTAGSSWLTGSSTADGLIRSEANLIFATGGNNQRAQIDSSGRLLIGTSTSVTGSGGSFQTQYARFQVLGNTSNDAGAGSLVLGRKQNTADITAADTVLGQISFTDAQAGDYANITASTDAVPGSGDYPGRLVFSVTADGAASPTERMRIGSNGQVQIGRTSPVGNERLALQNTLGPCGYFFQGGNIDEDVLELRNTYNQSGQTATYIRFSDSGGTTRGSITATTSATSYNTSSDYRLKENVTPVSDGISRLKQLKPNRFNFIEDPDTVVDGFLAHEVQTIVPEAITGEKDEVDDDGNPVYQGIDQAKLVPLLTAALQEAVAEIKALKDRVTALESA